MHIVNAYDQSFDQILSWRDKSLVLEHLPLREIPTEMAEQEGKVVSSVNQG